MLKCAHKIGMTLPAHSVSASLNSIKIRSFWNVFLVKLYHSLSWAKQSTHRSGPV